MSVIVNFHDVNDPVWFEKVITFLKKKYKVITIKQLESFLYNDDIISNFCHITVDDGHESFYNVIYPILKKLMVPCSLFVSPKMCIERKNFWFQEIKSFDINDVQKTVSDYLELDVDTVKRYKLFSILKNLPYQDIEKIIIEHKYKHNIGDLPYINITTDQLIEIDKDGLISIGAHTENHPILANENEQTSIYEIKTSFYKLENIIGHKIRYFAFPNGIPHLDFGEREIKILKEIDCKIAFTTSKGNLHKGVDPLLLPRIGFSHGSKHFINFKFTFSDYWDLAKNIINTTEKKQRLQIKQLLSK